MKTSNERYIVTYCSVSEGVNLSGPFISGPVATREEAEQIVRGQMEKIAGEYRKFDPDHVYVEECRDGLGNINYDNNSVYQWVIHAITGLEEEETNIPATNAGTDSSDNQPESGKNTKIHYCYTDAANYKCQNYAVVKGTFTKEQIDEIIGCLEDGEYFIPYQVGLDEERFSEWTEDDHPWFTLYLEDFTETDDLPNVQYYMAESGDFREMTAADLYQNFLSAKGKWDAEEAEQHARDYLASLG